MGSVILTSIVVSVVIIAFAGAPAQAIVTTRIEIGVAPAPNGLVMAGVPTQIAVDGFKGVAKVLRYDSGSRKWSLLGNVRAGRALPYTFQSAGIAQLRVVPKSGPSRSVKVGVYGQFPVGTKQPTVYGSTLMNSTNGGNGGRTSTVTKAAGCAMVDLGSNNRVAGGRAWTFQVISTGAPERVVPIPNGQSIATLNIPVSGDAVVTIVGENSGFGFADFKIGIVWTCLKAPF